MMNVQKDYPNLNTYTMTIDQIENGRYFENEQEKKNYVHTGYACHWDDGLIHCFAICQNEHGSTYDLGFGYILSGYPNPNWLFNHETLDLSELMEEYEARAESEWSYDRWVY